jgi:filamentous hemagglutinin family protein
MGMKISLVFALPQGGNVVSGSGIVAQSGNVMIVNQATNRLGINWESFSIGAGQWVQFNQPSASSVVLNRVLGSNPSEIFGRLTANGQVFITNPNGILFGRTAQVNVGGLVATTNQLSDTDWNESRYTFSKVGSAGSVVNQGELNAADAGYVALLAPEVRNEGVIRANLGSAILASGDKVTLQLNANSLLGFQIDQGALNALVENKNLVVADGGKVFLSARASEDVGRAVVNQSGVIRAQTIENKSGTILLMADMMPTESGYWQNHGRGTLNFSAGLLDASAPNGGDGGFVETSGAYAQIGDLARVTTLAASGRAGTWLIDPIDFTISSGSGSLMTSGIGANTLSTNLGSGNVTIITDGTTGGNGDIFVESDVSWAANKLTLSAHGSVYVRANLLGSGSAQLALEYGQASAGGTGAMINVIKGAQVNLSAGQNYFTKKGTTGSVVAYTVITSLGSMGSTTTTDLQGIAGGLTGNYALGADINASGTSIWNSGSGFAPLMSFSGQFDGLGHEITGLVINRSSTDNVGLFGSIINNGVVRNVGVSGTIRGRDAVGAVVGLNTNSSVMNSYATANVTGRDNVGGLVGSVAGTASVAFSYATGDVTGSGDNVGGLVGKFAGELLTQSFATGDIVATGNSVGGLIGWLNGGTISDGYATGEVSAGGESVGGLVGLLDGVASLVTKSYASVQITSAAFNKGGVVGEIGVGSVTSSYWNLDSNSPSLPGVGAGSSSGVTGLTTNQMKNSANFPGLDVTNVGGTTAVWRIYDGDSQPLLRHFLLPLTLSDTFVSNDGTVHSGTSVPSVGGRTGVAASGTAVGTYLPYSNQFGYDISDGKLTIVAPTPAAAVSQVLGEQLASVYTTTVQSISSGVSSASSSTATSSLSAGATTTTTGSSATTGSNVVQVGNISVIDGGVSTAGADSSSGSSNSSSSSTEGGASSTDSSGGSNSTNKNKTNRPKRPC